MDFNHQRLIFARMLRGKTIKDVADALGVKPQIICDYEEGKLIPEKIRDLAQYFSVPVNFFEQPDISFIEDQALSFRANFTLSEKVKNQAKAYASLAEKLNEKFEKMYSLPVVDIPDYSDLSPELAAISLRNYWGLGSHSIGNIIKLLEVKGIRVYSLDIDISVDANCRWHDSQPYVFLNQKTSAERSRFDAAHELGHIVRDRYLSVINDEREKEANRFAAAFLMPEEAVRYYAPSFITVQELVELKKKWGVSLVALAYRMYELGLIKENIYSKVIWPTISKLGYRKTEPQQMLREESTLFVRLKEKMQEDNLNFSSIACDLNLNIDDLHSITFNSFKDCRERLTLIRGNGIQKRSITKAHLRLVN